MIGIFSKVETLELCFIQKMDFDALKMIAILRAFPLLRKFSLAVSDNVIYYFRYFMDVGFGIWFIIAVYMLRRISLSLIFAISDRYSYPKKELTTFMLKFIW